MNGPDMKGRYIEARNRIQPSLAHAGVLAIATSGIVAISYLVVVSPTLALGFTAAIYGIVTGFAAPRLFFGLGLAAILMERTVGLHVQSAAVNNFDELFVGACALIFPTRRLISGAPLRRLPGSAPLLIFVAFGLLGDFSSGVSLSVSTQGTLLIVKGFILAWAVAQLDWDDASLLKSVKVGSAFAIAIIAGAAVNAMIPSTWNSIILGDTSYQGRFGLDPIVSIFQHPGYFGTVSVMAVLAALTFQQVFGRNRLTTFIIVGGIAAAVLSSRRKVLASLGISWLIIGVRRRAIPTLALLAFILPILAFISWGPISNVASYTYAEYFEDPEASGRVRLTTDSFRIAAEEFPLGAGFGQFGSATARLNYSPLYDELGYSDVWGLGPTEESGAFLTDTFWPAIIGEAGLLGSAFFGAVFVALIREFRRLSNSLLSWNRWLGILGIAWTAQLLIESVAGAVFTAVPTFGIYFAIVGIAASRSQNPSTGGQHGLPKSTAGSVRALG